MNSLRGAEADELLRIDKALITTLQRMAHAGASPDEMIRFLAETQVPKGGAIVALRRAKVMDPNEAKRAVHFSDAYADRRGADEAFEESVVQAMDEIERSEAAA